MSFYCGVSFVLQWVHILLKRMSASGAPLMFYYGLSYDYYYYYNYYYYYSVATDISYYCNCS